MDNFYQQNMTAFRPGLKILETTDEPYKDFTFEVIPAKNGSPTIRVKINQEKQIFLHSTYNPDAEAIKLVSICNNETGLYIVFGFGLGYHVEELLKVASSTAQIAILEPCRNCFKEALNQRSFIKIFKDKRISWFFGDDTLNFTYFFERLYDPLQSGVPELIIPPAMNHLYRDFFEKALQIIKDIASRKFVNINTTYVLGAGPVNNTLQNIIPAFDNPGCASLFDKFNGKPAIIVSSGPSLDKNIHELARAKGKAVIICAGSAIKAMVKAGIKPDFVYSIDPLKENYEWFFKNIEEGSALIANLQTHPDIINNFPGEKLLSFYGGTTVTALLSEEISAMGQTWSGGSVANDCLSFAYLTGANPLIFIGQDLSYTEEGQTYASGLNPEEVVVKSRASINQLMVKGNNGSMLPTGRELYGFLQWFERWIAERKDRRYINATEGGAFIAGTEIATLKEVIDRYCTESIDIEGMIKEARLHYTGIDRNAILRKFELFMNRSKELNKHCDQALEALKKLEKTCDKGKDQRQEEHLMKRVKKIFKAIEKSEICFLVEGLVPESVTTVLAKTYAAQRSDNDTYREAINTYMFYLYKIQDGCKHLDIIIKGLIDQMKSQEAC